MPIFQRSIIIFLILQPVAFFRKYPVEIMIGGIITNRSFEIENLFQRISIKICAASYSLFSEKLPISPEMIRV